MTFEKILAQVREQLQREGRVAYRILKRLFDLSDDDLEDLKADLIDAKRVAVDEEGKVLVWVGDAAVASSQLSVVSSSRLPTLQTSDFGLRTSDSKPQSLDARRDAGERRQLTVMFCDVVGSTALSEQLDPEELREVIRAYQETCAGVIGRFEGHIAQYLGDGLLVYFGYPVAHEDDAQRAVRAGLEIVAALQKWVPSPRGALMNQGSTEGQAQSRARQQAADIPLPHGRGSDLFLPHHLQVRIGIHTGPVVVGEMGGGGKREQLALGETPNIAARLQGLAEPDNVVVSAATQRLVAGLFECQDLGPQALKGISTPMAVYRVVGEGTARTRFDVAVGRGLTPLVGREEELGLLRRRWEQAKEKAGQVVLLSGEAGIGKSRLAQTLKEQVIAEGASRIEFRCSAYHQNSAFYPLIEHLQRLLQFASQETPQAKLTKLDQALARYCFPQADTLPLLAALLSLPHPEGTLPLTLSPQKQKQKTQEVLVAWVVEEAERTPVYCVWEDLHWADPSTLEVLTLVLDQVPTTRLLVLLTFRPDFTPPWGARSYLTQLTLNRLGRQQVEAMVGQVTDGKTLPVEVLQQIVAKTDGVPLFVEELTKMVSESIESVGSVGSHGRAPVTLGIPSTLQDALMARLDRLAPVRELAQIGAVLGREFSYELLHAVSSFDEGMLQQGLRQLVEAELIYQRGLPPRATYLFKHALVQDTAYQSLLKSRRQQLHQQIAQVLAERFPETVETQPELLAHHYTEASLIAQAVPYWQRAGERAAQRSANVEAVTHLTKALELLHLLSDTPERAQQELALQLALGAPLMATKGYAAPEVEQAYNRARKLCQRMGENPQLFRVLRGLWGFYMQRAELQTARELSEQLLNLAQSVQDAALLLLAHYGRGCTLYYLGELASSREHLAQGTTFYNPQQHHSLTFLYGGSEPGIACRTLTAVILWLLGYPDQALRGMLEAFALAQELSQPFNLAWVLSFVARLHYLRREGQAVQEQAEAEIALSGEHGFPYWLAVGTILRGWALVEQGKKAEGISHLRQGLAAHRATGSSLDRPYYLAMLAEACGKAGQAEDGLQVVAEALAAVDKTEERFYEAELYRLKGQLTLRQFNVQGSRFNVTNPQPLTPNTQHPAPNTQAEAEAEACFLRAIDIAQRQQAKSLELRAVMSLSRLWQQQGKKTEARQMLAEIYGWFTEGFEAKDLQEAKALLEELA
ncbi:MAG: AAA family ATPase [Deltaproteobacteria bacterium]|nr:AAA family ATPase [Deltaproteobacteria bacterium]